jgi:hypothetical protein
MVDSTFFDADLPYFATITSASLPAKHVLNDARLKRQGAR